MTGRSAPGYHLYRFPPPGPCLLYVATFDITIPRDAPRRRSIPESGDLRRVSGSGRDCRTTTGEGLFAVVLDASASA